MVNNDALRSGLFDYTCLLLMPERTPGGRSKDEGKCCGLLMVVAGWLCTRVACTSLYSNLPQPGREPCCSCALKQTPDHCRSAPLPPRGVRKDPRAVSKYAGGRRYGHIQYVHEGAVSAHLSLGGSHAHTWKSKDAQDNLWLTNVHQQVCLPASTTPSAVTLAPVNTHALDSFLGCLSPCLMAFFTP
jgi:hypothetical protein